MKNETGSQFQGLAEAYRRAADLGFPAFIHRIDESTPINATPYVVSLTDFLGEELTPVKRKLRNALASSLAELPAMGLRAEILLIGGSFLALESVPNDLDCVLYYSRRTPPSTDLALWQAKRRALGIDLRLVPIEMEPVMVLKTAIFFGVLYAGGRAVHPELRGVVLVDCSR
jgi:hypothetical protein